MSLLNIIGQFKHKAEMRESKDEILTGEIIHLLAEKGWPTVEFATNNDLQTIRFRTVNDPVLHSLRIRLDRKTGTGAIGSALLGSKATLYIIAEVKNMLADPDDLLNQWSTDLKNIVKIPMLGQVKVNHELNSIYGTKAALIEIDNYILDGEKTRENLKKLLDSSIDEIREQLKQYKKD